MSRGLVDRVRAGALKHSRGAPGRPITPLYDTRAATPGVGAG